MKIDWANDGLQIGRQWQRWGAHFPFGGWLLAFSGLGPSLKGFRNEAIVWDHKLAKDWGFYLGVYHNSGNDVGSRAVDDFARSPYPFVEGGVKYTSDSCGRIGNQIMMFDVGGFYGSVRNTWNVTDGATYNFVDDDTAAAWGLALKYYVPIIPERKGNKAGALGVGGNLFMGQNLGWYNGPGGSLAFLSAGSTADNVTYSYPHQWGGWFQLDYFFTNALSFHGWYSHAANSISSRVVQTGLYNGVKKNQQFIGNVSYDMNAAMRFGVEYAYINTKYADYLYNAGGVPTSNKKGTLNTIRIGAWYFF